MFKYLIITCLLASSDCYNILCLFPYPGKSHHMVFEPLLDELVSRGHNLTVVSFFPKSSPNRRDVSLEGLAPISLEVVDLSQIGHDFYGLEHFTTHYAFNTKLAEMNLKLCEKLINSRVFDEFIDGRGSYDLILVEDFNTDCMLGIIHNYGLPFIGLSSCGILPWVPARLGGPDNPAYFPSMLLPYTEKMTFIERVQNCIMRFFSDWWFEIYIRWEEQKVLEKRYGRSLPPLVEVAKNMSVLLINTHHSLNGVKVMPPSYVEVGGIHLHNKSVHPLPAHLEEWVSDENGFILISFGSLIRGSTLPKKQLDAILKVVGSMPQKFLWKWEAGHIDNLPPNVLITRWLPQYDLLRHPNCAAFITHGGLLSLTEAVASGVPTVVVAVLGDQFSNAAHTRAAIAAPTMTLAQLDEGSLSAALEDALSSRMRDRAKRLSALWHSRPRTPMETAVFYVEQTARFNGLRMSSHARHLNFVQYYLLDVIALIAVVIGTVLGGCCCLCQRCRRSEKLKVA